MGLPNPSLETKFSGANGDREIFIFPVQLTRSRIGNLTRLILPLAYVMTIHTFVDQRKETDIPLFPNFLCGVRCQTFLFVLLSLLSRPQEAGFFADFRVGHQYAE